MTIVIDKETESRLVLEAERTGQTPSALAGAMLADALARAEQERAETIAGIERGLEAIAEGRSRPLAEYIAEVQARRQQRGSLASGG